MRVYQTIRNLSSYTEDELLRLRQRTFAHRYGSKGGLGDDIDAELRRPGFGVRFEVVVHNFTHKGRNVGWVSHSHNPTMRGKVDCINLNIWVDRGFRRRHIGQRLLKRAMKYLNAEYGSIQVRVYPHDKASLRFFEKASRYKVCRNLSIH